MSTLETKRTGKVHVTVAGVYLLMAVGALGQKDVAARRPVHASSTYQNNSASNAVDGVITDSSRWIAQGPSTLVFELDGDKSLVAGDLYSGYQESAPVEAFHFEVEEDGQWLEVPGGKVRDNDQLAIRVAFERPVSARRVRLVITNLGPQEYARVREVRLWVGALDKLPALEQRSNSPMNPVFDLTRHQIFLNQSGFNTGWSKRFTAPISEDGTTFAISSITDNRALYHGTVKNGIGDFTDFRPADPHLLYRIVLSGGDLAPGVSDPFYVAPLWFQRVTLDLAVQFFIDTRSMTGSHPTSFGGGAWRDNTHYAYVVPSLVNLYLANPSLYNQSAVEMDWKRDLSRVLSHSTIGKMYETLDGPVGDRVPDAVQLIHWGTSWNYVQISSLQPEAVSDFAYFLYGLPVYGKWFTPKYVETMRACAFSRWESAGLFKVNKAIGTFKGIEAPGWTILPNLMMHEVARREGRAEAGQFLEAAVAQAVWCIEELDLEDPVVTKGQRMSEHKSVSGLVTLLKHYPGEAPEGLEDHLRKRADIAIRRSGNMWDFRKYDDGANWSLPRAMPGMTGGGTAWNEPGNLACFPFIAWDIASVLGSQPGDDERIRRLNELAVSHFDSLFGRNPLGFHSGWRGPLDFKGVERGWPVKYRPICAFLETVRGALNSSAATEHYPFNPGGAFRHPEGWVAFNSAYNMGLTAAIRRDSSITLQRSDKTLTIELRAPVFRPTATVTVSAGAEIRDVTLLATDYQQDVFRVVLKLSELPRGTPVTVSHGFGYFGVASSTDVPEQLIGCRTKKLSGEDDMIRIPPSGLGLLLFEKLATRFPGGVEVWTEDETAEAEDVFGSFLAPEHAGLFEATTDDRFAARLDHARTDEPALGLVLAVLGARGVAFQIVDLQADGFTFGFAPLGM